MKTFFKQNYDLMMSYLNAQPSNKNFSNKIYTKSNIDVTVTAKNKKSFILPMRSQNNGMSQFNVYYSIERDDGMYDIELKNIRVETNFFKGKLTIFANKNTSLIKSDVLMFGNETTTYLSEGPHTWLEDEKYFKIVEANFPFGKKVVYEYNVKSLIDDRKIVELLRNPNKSLMTVYKGETPDGTPDIEYKKLYTYSDKEYFQINKLFVQCDKKQAYPVFFTYYGCRYTNRMGTIPNIANDVARIITQNPDAIAPGYIKNKLYRCLRDTERKGIATPAVFKLPEYIAEKLRNNINFDPDLLYNNNFIVFLSKIENFDVIKNKKVLKTEDIKQYRKENAGKYAGKYNLKKKVQMYLKRHNNTFNPKWNIEEKNIAEDILKQKLERVD